MDFALSDDQKQWQASLAGALARASPLDRVRAFADGDEPVARDIWGTLTELGVPALLIPEEYGGLGLGLLDAALSAELLGGQTVPAPFLGSAVLAPLAIMLGGDETQKSRWLPALAAGEIIAGAALTEAVSGARDGAGVTAAGGALTGSSLFVMDGAEADLLIVADRDGGLFLVERGAPGLALIPLKTIDLTQRLCAARFDATPAESLGMGDSRAHIARLRDAAWTILAADMLGASQIMLDKAVAYAKERRQFGRLIGSFQAVKHMCAEMAAALEPCRSLVWYAGYAWDTDAEDASVVAAHAKAHLSEVSRFVARTATEVHGGMGITDLLGLHFAFKRVGLDRQLLGGPERVRDIAAGLQGLVSA
jgi:alkylation response protein AidB-like acyl-CoA dehydrogenase